MIDKGRTRTVSRNHNNIGGEYNYDEKLYNNLFHGHFVGPNRNEYCNWQ